MFVDIDWSQSLSNGLLLFKRDILPAVFASLSPNLASLAVKYIFDTIFRHFHLYSLVLGDEAVIVTNQIVVEVATVKSIPELEKGLEINVPALKTSYCLIYIIMTVLLLQLHF